MKIFVVAVLAVAQGETTISQFMRQSSHETDNGDTAIGEAVQQMLAVKPAYRIQSIESTEVSISGSMKAKPVV